MSTREPTHAPGAPLPEPPPAPHRPADSLPLGPQRLHPRVVAVWRVGALVWAGFLSIGAAVALLVLEWPLTLALAVLAALLVHAWVVPAIRYRHWGYRVGPVDVRVRHGWLWRTVSVVLHSRIQHVDTRQGPVERMMGLATVVMFTAGSVGASVAIPGLAAADAEALRDRLAALSGTDDAV